MLRSQITDMASTRDVRSSARADIIDALGLRGDMVSCTAVRPPVTDATREIQTTESIEKELQNRLRKGPLASDLMKREGAI